MELKNNTILITGGTSGLGLQFASHLLMLGNTVIVTGRNQAKLDETKKLFPEIHTIQSDISDPKQIATLFQNLSDQFPSLNILINNAGEMQKINLHDPSIDITNLTREIDINLIGPIRLIQVFLPHLKTKKIGAIVNITSGLALIPFPISPIYGASKAGLRSYTKSLRIQLKHTKIKVFEVVAPAAKTPLSEKFSHDIDGNILMDPTKLVETVIAGMRKDKYEIYPGMAKAIKIMSRLLPSFLLKQMSKPVDKMLEN